MKNYFKNKTFLSKVNIKMNEQTKLVYDEISKPNINSVLNIGFRHDSDKTIYNYCMSNNKTWTVLEIYEPNCETMKTIGIDVICGDVRNIKNVLNKNFDAIIWLHGPEHILWNDFLKCRTDIEEKANNIVIYQAPIGKYDQDEMYGNPYEKHVTTLTSNMFAELGYETINHDKNGEFTFSAIRRI